MTALNNLSFPNHLTLSILIPIQVDMVLYYIIVFIDDYLTSTIKETCPFGP